MNEGKDENDYNEAQARDLADYLLANDIPIFEKFRKEIKAMDSHSFISLFQGIPFKSPEKPDGFEYKVKNKKSFEELIKKFDNFYDIINSWYPEKKYYPYIKQLWENYISIKHLARMNENKREELLNSYDIDYKNWPEEIKKDFIKVIAPSRHKTISQEEAEELKELNEEVKNLYEEMNKFKSVIEHEPEMITYEKNTDKLIDILKEKLKDFFKNLCEGKGGYGLSILGSLSIVNSLGVFDSFNDNGNYNDYEDWDDLFDYNDDLFQNSENSNQESILKKLLNNQDFQLYAYTASSFILLGWSVYEFYNASKDLNEIKERIKGKNGYEEKLKKIKERFKKNKEKIGILPDDFRESLKIISEVFKEIRQDYNELEDLINNINKDIEIAEEHENKSTLGLIASVGLLIVGIALTKNPFTVLHGASLTSNVASGVGNAIIISDSIDTKKKLKKILTDAEEQEKKIKEELDNLNEKLSELEKGRLIKFEKKFQVKTIKKKN